MKQDKVYISHILEAIGNIEKFMEDTPSSQIFFDDLKTQSAIIRQLEIIGEATNKLSADFRDSHQNIPYAQIVALRNRLIHEYFGVDLFLLWEVIRRDVPELKSQISNIDML